MVSHCLFGIFVFGSSSTLIYRFLTEELLAHLRQCFVARGYVLNDDPTETDQISDDGEIHLSIDDALSQHLSVMINVYAQTSERNCAIRQITLDSGIQVFFDQIAEDNLICMADRSFDSIVVLKALNLLKSLIKFHMGALPFTAYNAGEQLIERISASLQFFLNNVLFTQALLFESCEYLHINSLIRQQCIDAYAILNRDVQFWLNVTPSIMLITCNDKIVHLHLSSDQCRPNHSDLFLLLLNNSSRSHRNQFKCLYRTNILAHTYRPKSVIALTTISEDDLSDKILKKHTRTIVDQTNSRPAHRSYSLPAITGLLNETTNQQRDAFRRSEVVFMQTTNRIIAPFTLYTMPLTNEISVLALVEWKGSAVCSNLYELIRSLDQAVDQQRFRHEKLLVQVKAVENNTAVRRFFEIERHPTNILSKKLNEAQALFASSTKKNLASNEQNNQHHRILTCLSNMSRLATDAFRHLFFDSNEYALLDGGGIEDNEETELEMDPVDPSTADVNRARGPAIESHASAMTHILRKKLTTQLDDWFSFIEVKAQRNITLSFCHNDFPGLVHFVLVDRQRGRICTPSLILDEHQSIQDTNNEVEHFVEHKILAFELECLSTLQRGYTSYTMTDEHFTYNYILRLQESNGASVRLHKPFVQFQPPGVLHFDFYKMLARENCPSLVYQSSIACFELVCVHLRIVPSSNVREQCEQLWPRLMELDE